MSNGEFEGRLRFRPQTLTLRLRHVTQPLLLPGTLTMAPADTLWYMAHISDERILFKDA